MKIEKDKMVSIHYTLKDDNGTQLDTSVGADPLSYIHGNGYLIVGLENALEGKETGERLNVTVQPEEAYGTRDDRLVATLPRDRFDFEGEIQVGMQFQVGTPAGPTVVRVIEVNKDTIKIDGNHELADKVLHFEVEIVDVRDLTDDEKARLEAASQGCGGGCGGCGGNCGGDCGGDCNGDCNGEGCGSENCNCQNN